MLVLQRRPSQSILISKNIEITVLSNDKGAIHIGIKAPKKINIIRKELLKKND